tara:strand:+ start:1170 stop:1313 length:144 start_codon:yes stop_codon:yes gene_type:complete
MTGRKLTKVDYDEYFPIKTVEYIGLETVERLGLNEFTERERSFLEGF